MITEQNTINLQTKNETHHWQTEMREAVRDIKQLSDYFNEYHPNFNFKIEDFKSTRANNSHLQQNQYPIFLPKRLIAKMIEQGRDSALYRQFLPSNLEHDFSIQQSGLIDPIGDQVFQVTKHLIHRYHNRALFLPTNICPTICRYCFRKNELYDGTWGAIQLDDTRQYLNNHPEINEIIFTGGDPLSLSNEKLDHYLNFFSQFEHIKFIRFHTRFPVIIPRRIDNGFIQVIEQYKSRFYQISIAIHCNHHTEFDNEVFTAIEKLRSLNIQLLSQTVLLKNVNADFNSLLELFNTFIRIGIRPYYLHHPDVVKGAMHFRMSLKEGRKLYQQLRNQLPGWAIPQYVVDLPQGQGKTPAYNPETHDFGGEFINRHNQLSKYSEYFDE